MPAPAAGSAPVVRLQRPRQLDQRGWGVPSDAASSSCFATPPGRTSQAWPRRPLIEWAKCCSEAYSARSACRTCQSLRARAAARNRFSSRTYTSALLPTNARPASTSRPRGPSQAHRRVAARAGGSLIGTDFSSKTRPNGTALPTPRPVRTAPTGRELPASGRRESRVRPWRNW